MLSEADVQFINKYALFAKLIDKAINAEFGRVKNFGIHNPGKPVNQSQ